MIQNILLGVLLCSVALGIIIIPVICVFYEKKFPRFMNLLHGIGNSKTVKLIEFIGENIEGIVIVSIIVLCSLAIPVIIFWGGLLQIIEGLGK